MVSASGTVRSVSSQMHTILPVCLYICKFLKHNVANCSACNLSEVDFNSKLNLGS